MKKRIIPILLVLLVLLSSLAFSFSALAITNNNIVVNKFYTNSITGADDKIWYTFTPSVSGKYAFVSYSQSNEAYLFTKSNKMYNQIQYAKPEDPNYLNNFRYFVDSSGKEDTSKKHYSTTFYMESYLIKGTTYYYAAGFANERDASGTINVALYNLSVDESEQTVESISVECSSSLSAYTDGEWRVDDSGNRYFYYNYSRILQNMTIVINKKDGSKDRINATDDSYDGMKISYGQNQKYEHWYAQNSDEYKKNSLVISVGLMNCEYDVQIENSAMYGIRGKVLDYVTNEPIADAIITVNGNPVGEKTDTHGNFAFVYTSGTYTISVKTNSSIDYSFQFTVDTNNTSANNLSSKPIKLLNCDYNKDGIINAKDYAYAIKNGYAYYPSITNFTKANY